ncbi:hypothetical protein EXIGLDRAFT_834396, partial [Exidia glandulosa HHB12029]
MEARRRCRSWNAWLEASGYRRYPWLEARHAWLVNTGNDDGSGLYFVTCSFGPALTCRCIDGSSQLVSRLCPHRSYHTVPENIVPQ